MFEIGKIFTADDTDIMCYDISDKFAYFAPFSIDEENNAINLDLTRTTIYSIEEDFCDYPVTEIIKTKNQTANKHTKFTELKEKQKC